MLDGIDHIKIIQPILRVIGPNNTIHPVNRRVFPRDLSWLFNFVHFVVGTSVRNLTTLVREQKSAILIFSQLYKSVVV